MAKKNTNQNDAPVEATNTKVNPETPKLKNEIILEVIESFTDKFDNKITYVAGNEITITDTERANDLVARKLCIKKDR